MCQALRWAPFTLTSPMPSSRRLSEPTPALCARRKLSQQLVCPPQMSITQEIWWLGCQPLKILDTSLQFVLSVECPPCPLSFGSWEEVRSVSFGSPSRRPPILKRVFFSDAPFSLYPMLPVEAEAQRRLQCTLGYLDRVILVVHVC